MLRRVPWGEAFVSLDSSSDDMEDRDVEEGDCLGVSLGEAAADDLEEAWALLRVAIRGEMAVEAMMCGIRVEFQINIQQFN